MENIYVKYSLIAIILFLIQLFYFKLADKFNIIDKPNERSSHTKVTLRGGGIIFYIAVLLFFFLSDFQYLWFFIGLTLIAAISFADDIKPRSSKLRLSVHFLSMLLMFYQWDLFSFPSYFVLISLILCTGILNAYNFMDGINGITGGYSMVALIALWYINNFQCFFVDNQLIYILVISLLVFNFFNFRKKAKCFAGDVGSVSIAFILIFMLGKLIIASGNFSYLILLAVYGVDTVLTIIHRIMLKENIFEAHRKHLYQIMANELHIPHMIVSSVYIFVQFVVSAGFMFIENKWLYFIVSILVLSVIYIIFQKKYFHLHISRQ